MIGKTNKNFLPHGYCIRNMLEWKILGKKVKKNKFTYKKINQSQAKHHPPPTHTHTF